MTAATPANSLTDAELKAACEQDHAMLGELAQASLALSLELQKRTMAAMADDAEGVPTRAVAAFGRASRMVRHAIFLRSRLVRDLRIWDRPPPTPRSSTAREDTAQPDAALPAFAECRKIRVARLIADHACIEHNDAAEVRRFVREAAERLEDEDLQDDLRTLSLADLSRRVARDIGLVADWPGLDRRTWTRFELPPPEPAEPVDQGPPRRQTCLDRPDPVLATKKGPGPPPPILYRTVVWPADRRGTGPP